MPIQIPKYQEQLGDAGLPGYQQNFQDRADAALGSVGEGIVHATSGFADLISKVRDEQDSAAQMDAYGKLGAARESLLNDPQNGLTAQKGKDALAQRDSVITSYDAVARSIADNLSGERQQLNFQKLFVHDRQSFIESVDNHVAKESDVVAAQAFDGAVATARSEAANAAMRGEYEKVEQAVTMGHALVDTRAQHQGWDPAYTEAQARTVATQTRIGVVDSLVDNGRNAEAKAYLAAHRGEMDGAILAQSNIDKRVNAASDRDEGFRLATNIWKDAGGNPAKAEQILRDKDVKNTSVFDDALKRIQQQGAEDAEARRQADSPRLGRIEQAMLTRGSFSTASDDYAQLSDEGKATALRMREAERRAQHAQAGQERSIQSQIDREAESDFRSRDLIGSDGADQATTDIQKQYPDASVRQRNLLIEKQKQVQRVRDKDRGVSLDGFQAMVKETAANQRYNDKDTKLFATFMHDTYVNWRLDPKNEGKVPNQEETRKMIGDATRTVIEKGTLWDSKNDQWRAIQRGKQYVPVDAGAAPAPPPAAPQAARPASAPEGSIRVTDGKSFAWLPPGRGIPEGWRAAQ